jgi:hypothetical protein
MTMTDPTNPYIPSGDIEKPVESLAWNATAVASKKQLLAFSHEEKDRLLAAGKKKDAYFALASTCVDIIHTAVAAIKELNQRIEQTQHGDPGPLKNEWEKLLKEASGVGREAVSIANKEDKAAWTPGDFEVIGTITLCTGNDSPEEIMRAISCYEEGIKIAEKQKKKVPRALLFAQLVRAAIATGNKSVIEQSLQNLHACIMDSEVVSEIDTKHMTRLWRALAEGAKSLAIHYAKISGSENQELKARQI